jgi:hypothetical protein
MRLFSYIVRYDSGFAPNPFYGWCTLATCKPKIRASAKTGDWVLGTGSNDRKVQLGGHLVYAMRVTEAMTFGAYNADPRFQSKKPYRCGSRKQSCGDNIYYPTDGNDGWLQRDSFHSAVDGTQHAEHVQIDTDIDRVLVSNDFVYFGGDGPDIPARLVDGSGRSLCKHGIGYIVFDDQTLIANFETWLAALGDRGYQGPPFEWMSLRD